jgi:hypothetical protein
MVGIQQTGLLNEETLTWMGKPRCGLPDRVPEGTAFDLPEGVVVAQSYSVPGKNNFYKMFMFLP